MSYPVGLGAGFGNVIRTAAELESLRLRLGGEVTTQNNDALACATVNQNTLSSWKAFYASWVAWDVKAQADVKSSADFPWYTPLPEWTNGVTNSETYDQGLAIENQLATWQKAFAGMGCKQSQPSVVVPPPPTSTTDNLAAIVKWGAIGLGAIAVVYVAHETFGLFKK